MHTPTATKPEDSLLCRSTSCGGGRHGHASWWPVALRQGGTAVVPRYEDRSLSAARACAVWADGMTAKRPPFDGVIAVATKAHASVRQGGPIMRTFSRLFPIGLAALTLAVVGAPAAYAGSCSVHQTKAKAKDIVDTAVHAGSFTTLVKAVQAAGLVETLKGEGPLTVFAPTDAAFAKLPEGTVAALLNDLPKLRAVLKYHVVAGKVQAADVVQLKSAKTMLGQSVRVNASDGVKINDANVVKTDILCSNGVIHVIDAVLLPQDDLLDVAHKAGAFKTLSTAVYAAGLADALRGPGPFTVFAPTDEAFAKLPEGTVAALLKQPDKLKAVLTYHVVSGKLTAEDVVKLKEAKTLQGQKLAIDTSAGVKVNNAKVVQTDVAAANGVIHVIDTVLLPSAASEATAAR